MVDHFVSWSSKKQNSVALSTAEAEYIAAGACAQILYMKQTLLDYGVVLEKVPLLCDNESAVKLANNPVQHSLSYNRPIYKSTSTIEHVSRYLMRT